MLVAEDAEGRGVFGLSHGGCILLDARGPDKSTCLSSSGSRSLGAGERGTIVFRKKGRGLGVRSLAHHVPSTGASSMTGLCPGRL